MDITSDFLPGQIVSLDDGDRNLYAEVIQVVTCRDLCWVRPLLLANFSQELPLITDLRDSSDLLWPVNLFRPVLDTEVISLVSQLFLKEPKSETATDAKKQLHQFIYQLWQAQKS